MCPASSGLRVVAAYDIVRAAGWRRTTCPARIRVSDAARDGRRDVVCRQSTAGLGLGRPL